LASLDRQTKLLEIGFTAGFSAVVFLLFFFILGANGLVLGNDSAVHLNTALYYLNAGQLSIGDIAWYTPLYHIVLDNLIAFTGVTTFEQTLVLMKAFTALVDWLVVFSVYVVATKFLDRKTGALAAGVMLFAVPMFELNAWGGYTSLLSLAFMSLCLMYLALTLKGSGNTLVAFVLSFSLVLSHQLATFLAVIIIAPVVLVALFKLRGRQAKGLLAIVLGGAIAFGIYYLRPILPYISDLFTIVLFQLTVYSFQIPFVTFNSFMTYFGFLLLFAFAGLVMGYFELRKRKALSFYVLLVLAFGVPLLLTQSYLVGISLPYNRFVYFLMPPLAILAAIPLSQVIRYVLAAFRNNRAGIRRVALKVVAVAIVVALVAVMVVRFQTVSANIAENSQYYSTSDSSGYQVGKFIKTNFNQYDQGVVTERPGHWLSQYTNMQILTQTDPAVDLSFAANCILDMSYEIMNPLTTTKVYDSKSISDSLYYVTNMVWKQGAYFNTNGDGAYVTYRDANDTLVTVSLSTLNRTVSMDELNWPKRITINYEGPVVSLQENILVQNDSYPVTVTWEISAENQTLNYVSLWLCEQLEPSLMFTKANIPELLSWSNPNENPTKTDPGLWSTTEFTSDNLQSGSAVDIYDPTDQVGFALKFSDVPAWGNVGALANGRIDAMRWKYNFWQLVPNYTVTVQYQMVMFAMDSCPQLSSPQQMDSLFSLQVEPFTVDCRNFPALISDNNVKFIVYDATKFDPKMLTSGWLQLIYSNNEYVVLKIKLDHPSPYILQSADN
jgi:hypothetical protein